MRYLTPYLTPTGHPSVAALMATAILGTPAHVQMAKKETGATKTSKVTTGGKTAPCQISAFGDMSGDIHGRGDVFAGDINKMVGGMSMSATCSIAGDMHGDLSIIKMAKGDLFGGDAWIIGKKRLGDLGDMKQFGDVAGD